MQYFDNKKVRQARLFQPWFYSSSIDTGNCFFCWGYNMSNCHGARILNSTFSILMCCEREKSEGKVFLFLFWLSVFVIVRAIVDSFSKGNLTGVEDSPPGPLRRESLPPPPPTGQPHSSVHQEMETNSWLNKEMSSILTNK
jgi:hypothetical protein